MHELIRDISKDTGWNNESIIEIFISFIHEHSHTQDFEAYIRDRAEYETQLRGISNG